MSDPDLFGRGDYLARTKTDLFGACVQTWTAFLGEDIIRVVVLVRVEVLGEDIIRIFCACLRNSA